ncbi:hypothetical protein JOC76_005152 [Neobacillus cucumis]|nr:hypothetical protein [Neobacillus cucumis]
MGCPRLLNTKNAYVLTLRIVQLQRLAPRGLKLLPKGKQKAPSFWERLKLVGANQGACAFLTFQSH